MTEGWNLAWPHLGHASRASWCPYRLLQGMRELCLLHQLLPFTRDDDLEFFVVVFFFLDHFLNFVYLHNLKELYNTFFNNYFFPEVNLYQVFHTKTDVIYFLHKHYPLTLLDFAAVPSRKAPFAVKWAHMITSNH